MVLKVPKISFSTLFVLFPLLYFNSCTFEFIKPFSFVLPLVGVFMLAWFLVLVREEAIIDLRSILPMAAYAFILLILSLMGAQKRVSILPTDLRNTLYLLYFMCVFAIYSGEQYENDRSLIVSVWTVDTVICCGYSIYRLIREPNLSRLLSTGSYHGTAEVASARGIASFGVVYGLVLIVLVFFFLSIQNKKNRILNIGLVVLFSTLLIFAQFLIAILFVVVGMVWIFFINNPHKGRKKLILFISFILLAVIGLFCLPYLLEFLIDRNIFRYEITARLEELLVLFKGGSLAGTDIASRFLQYSISWRAFTDSYGLGKIVIDSVEVGFHSSWLDGLGNYGAVYILYIAAVFMFYRFVQTRLPNQKSGQLFRMLFAVYVVMSLINTSVWAPITLSLCVIVPFLCLDRVSA